MDKNLHQKAKAPMIALINPTSHREVINTCKSIIYKQTKALKGRPDVKHGCNPCAQTQDMNRCNCAPRAILLVLLLALLVPLAVQAQTYPVNINCGEGGSIVVSNIPPSQWGDNPQSITEASEGDRLYFVITSDEGYNVSNYGCITASGLELNYFVAGNFSGENYPYYVMPAEAVTFNVTFHLIVVIVKDYTVTVQCVDNGHIWPISVSPSEANEGEIVVIEINNLVLAYNGLRLKSLVCIGESGTNIPITQGNLDYSFTMPAENVTVTATFEKVKAKLSALTVTEGILTPAFDGDVLDYTVIVDVDEIGISASSAGSYIHILENEWKAGSLSYTYGSYNAIVGLSGTIELAIGDNVIHIHTTIANGFGEDQTYTVTVIRCPEGTIALMDNTDNRNIIEAHLGTPCNVWMHRFTLRKDGTWNPLVLPFGLATLSGTPLEGAEVRTVESASFANDTLTMNFTEPTDEIIAGYPYLLRWNGGEDIIGPVFDNVTLYDDIAFYYSEESGLMFFGFYYPYDLDPDPGSNELYMGDDNKMHYPCDTVTISAFRPYFMIADSGMEPIFELVWCEMHLGTETLISTFPGFITAGNWNEAANWNTNDMPTADNQVAIMADAIIPAGFAAHATEVYLPDTVSLTIEDGGQLYHTNAGVAATIEKTITAYTANNNGWHLISYPFAGSGLITNMTNLLENNYDLYYYDELMHYWMNYKDGSNNFTKLEAAQGYLYANSQEVTLGMTGTLEAGNATVSVPLSYSEMSPSSEPGISLDVENPLPGFNLVGNPFAHNVTTYTGTDVANECYRLNEFGDELIISTVDASHPLKPGEGFFVKATGNNASITFNANAKGETEVLEPVERPNPQASERSLNLEPVERSKGATIQLEITQNGLLIDRFILKSEGAPLEKFTLNENSTRIFATRDRQDWATIPMEGNEQTVSFKAAKDGTYTLRVNVGNMDLDYLHLIDNMTGADVDLLVHSAPEHVEGPTQYDGVSTGSTTCYTFTAKTTDYESRFRLVFNADDASTGSASDAPFAFVNNGNIVITADADDATLQVIDMMGRVIRTVGLSQCGSRTITGMSSGVYVLRLIDGDSIRTQKIVIE